MDMELSDGWCAHEADDALRRAYYRRDFDDRVWEPVTVPGHWRSHAAFSDSDGPLLHRCRFTMPRLAPGRRAWLTYDGIFYQADHWLDGSYLGDTEGYFAPHTFEVTDALRTRDDHTLSLEVACSPRGRHNLTGAFQSGRWTDPDWNPGGLWRPVRLTETGAVRISTLQAVCREATPQRATMAFRALLDSDTVRTVRLHTTIGGLEHAADHPLAAGENTLDWTVTIERPELWWPQALGTAHLYDVRVAVHLAQDEAPGGEQPGDRTLSDQRRLRTGLRTVRMKGSICSVNGERIFLKGSSLGPTRMDLGYATPEELQRDVDLAVGTGLDFLRVHGHVTRPELYDAADEAGLLVWQDFPLPRSATRGVRRRAGEQARQAVDLLAHHPSVAIWHAPTYVKRTLERADGTRPVIPHRPEGLPPVVSTVSAAAHPRRVDGTDSHLYLGWRRGDERALPALLRAVPRLARFVTELGAQAVPSGDGADWMEPHHWPYLDWDRLTRTHGLDKVGFSRYVQPAHYPTFDAWRDATQRYQATVIRHHIETLRRLKYRPTGGFAQFCFADAHPAVSCSVLDHERRPKLGYDALRAACRPVIVVADRLPETLAPGGRVSLDVHVVSDLRDPLAGAMLAATLSWMGGRRSLSWSGDLPPDACVKVGTFDAAVPDAPGPVVLDLVVRLPGGVTVTNRYESSVVP